MGRSDATVRKTVSLKEMGSYWRASPKGMTQLTCFNRMTLEKDYYRKVQKLWIEDQRGD